MKAGQQGTPVAHPLLDKVKECSANPDADFFCHLLHPCPSCRLSVKAFTHRYIAATFHEMITCVRARRQTGNSCSLHNMIPKSC